MTEVAMLYSGGLDSFVSAAILLGQGKKVRAIFFDYGQVTCASEWVAAVACIKHLQEAYGPTAIRLWREQLSDYYKYVSECAIVGHTAPDASQDASLVFVPGRNLLFTLMTAIKMYNDGIRELALSTNSTDTLAGDCRPECLAALQEAFRWGFGMKGEQEPYKIWSPLQEMTKGQVVREGVKRGLPLEKSWSCYRPGVVHCGVCRNCVQRVQAFEEAGDTDETEYLETWVESA